MMEQFEKYKRKIHVLKENKEEEKEKRRFARKIGSEIEIKQEESKHK